MVAPGGTGPRIRQATPDEISQVIERLRAVGMMWEDVSAPRTAFLVGTDRRDIVGFVRFEQDGTNALIGSLYVEPEYRSTGLAKSLVLAAETAAWQAGVTQLILFSISTGDYFRSLGYEDIAVESAIEAVRRTPQAEWYAAHPEELAREMAFSKHLG